MTDAVSNAMSVWRQVFVLLKHGNPKLTILVGCVTISEALVGIGVLYIIKSLIDTLSTQLGVWGTNEDVSSILFYLGLTAGGLLMAAFFQVFGNFLRTAHGLEVSDQINREIHDRAIQVDLGFYESPRYFDTLQRARQAGPQRPAQIVTSSLLLMKSAIFLLAVFFMIGGIDWRILPGILLAVAAVLYVRIRFTRRLFKWQRQRTQLERRSSYFDWLITSMAHAKELRMGGLGGLLRDAYTELRDKIRIEHLRIEKGRSVAELIVTIIGALVFAAATVFLVFEALDGRVSIGDLVLFVLLFRRAESNGRELVTYISKLYDDQLYLGQLFDFLSVKSQIIDPAHPEPLPEPLSSGLRFEAVGFRYPGNDFDTLSDINLILEPGKVVALVGENGSGKTSLIKLMTRLYDPDRGRITLDGTDIRSFRTAGYRQLFSVIFQDYSRYAATAAENIRYGDVRIPQDSPRIEEAARRAGAHSFIKELRAGYETPLTRMFDDGQEISVGQWQRVALARAFLPDSKFVIMDEPTSSLDPRIEFELFDNFRERLGTRGALIISHRLSTVRQADYIYVLEKGKIAEHGTHAKLVAGKGLYASLFEKQGRNYR